MGGVAADRFACLSLRATRRLRRLRVRASAKASTATGQAGALLIDTSVQPPRSEVPRSVLRPADAGSFDAAPPLPLGSESEPTPAAALRSAELSPEVPPAFVFPALADPRPAPAVPPGEPPPFELS